MGKSSVFNFILRPLGYKTGLANLKFPSSKTRQRSAILDLIYLHKQFLHSSGWLESMNNRQSFFNNQYWPWITFSAINFLETLDLSKLKIVEFGGGASSLYFASRARTVTVFEFNDEWFRILEDVAPGNVEVFSPSESVNLCERLVEEHKLKSESRITVSGALACVHDADIILIDGGPRETLIEVMSLVGKDSLILIVDNSDRIELQESIFRLKKRSFLEIPFTGLSPLNTNEIRTSFFVKSINILRVIQK